LETFNASFGVVLFLWAGRKRDLRQLVLRSYARHNFLDLMQE